MSLLLRSTRDQGGKSWGQICLNNEVLGYVEILAAGYIVSGKRKPVATLYLAAEQQIKRRIANAKSVVIRETKLLDDLMSFGQLSNMNQDETK